MKIAICEDNYNDACELEQMIRDVTKEHNIHLSLQIFSSGENLLSILKSPFDFYDIYFIDICLKEQGLDGLETARQVKAMDKDGKFVFVTISREYAVDAFSLNALHYLVKPFTHQQVKEIFKRYDDRQFKKLLVLPQGKEEISLFMENILYVESSHNYCTLVTSGGEITVRVSMREMEERLDILPIPYMAMVILLGNMLENAMHACQELEDSSINLHMGIVNEMLVIEMDNSCKEMADTCKGKEDTEDWNPPEAFSSTRKNGGIGMRSMKQIVQENGGVMECKIEDSRFWTRAILNWD